jgi:ribosomal protein L27
MERKSGGVSTPRERESFARRLGQALAEARAERHGPILGVGDDD